MSSTLRSLSTVYREQGRLETAQELDKLTGEKVLNKSQQDRVAELLAASEAAESPSPSASPASKIQVRIVYELQNDMTHCMCFAFLSGISAETRLQSIALS